MMEGRGTRHTGGRRFAVDASGVAVPSVVVEASEVTEAEGSKCDMRTR